MEPTAGPGHARVAGSPGLDARLRGALRLVLPLMAAAAAAGWLIGAAGPACGLRREAALALLLALCAGGAFYARWWRDRMRHFLKGARGEELTALALARLPSGYEVFHGLRLSAWKADADHVVVGPNGVFVIETKNWSGDLRVRDQKITVGGRPPDHPPLPQVREAASRVRRTLEAAIRHPVPVQPVLCFVGEGLEPPLTGSGGVMICRLSALDRVLRDPLETGLEAGLRGRICDYLRAHVSQN
jgi:hypothetical protein